MWATADMAFGFMTLINVIAILALSPTVLALLRDYQRRKNDSELSFSADECQVQGFCMQKDTPLLAAGSFISCKVILFLYT